MKYLRSINLVLAALAILPPAAHVMELPNKLALDGPLWLAVQRHLYRGWGPFFGAPVTDEQPELAMLLDGAWQHPARSSARSRLWCVLDEET